MTAARLELRERSAGWGLAALARVLLVCLPLVCALMVCARAALAQDAPLTPESLMAELARTGSGKVRFTEVKTSALLRKPIELTGTLVFVAPARLERHVRSPREERFVVDGESLVIEAGGERRTLRLPDYPAIRAFVESIRGTLAGNLTSLRRFYRVEAGGTAGQWWLVLLPREPEMAELVQSIRIDGNRGRIARIEILETSGDRSVMTLAQDAP